MTRRQGEQRRRFQGVELELWRASELAPVSPIFKAGIVGVEACSGLIFGVMRSLHCSPSICTLPPPSYHTSSLSLLFVGCCSSSMFKIRPPLPSDPPTSRKTDRAPGREAGGSHTTIDLDLLAPGKHVPLRQEGIRSVLVSETAQVRC